MTDGTTTSTNVQSWKQKYTGNKPLRKAKETVYAGISVRWFYIAGFWCLVSVVLSAPLIFISDYILQCFIVALELMWWAVFYINFRTCAKYEESLLTIKYMIADYKGVHELCKFDMDVRQLQTYIPIKNIHARGLIEYTRGRFGVLIEYFPPTDPGDQMETHLLNIQALINRLAGDMQVDFISSSRFGTKSPLLKKFEKMINDPSTPPKNIKLIKSQYDKVKSGKVAPDWAFYISLGLGSHATVADAADRLNTELPGFLDGLSDASIIASQIVSETELVKNFIQFMVPRDL